MDHLATTRNLQPHNLFACSATWKDIAFVGMSYPMRQMLVGKEMSLFLAMVAVKEKPNRNRISAELVKQGSSANFGFSFVLLS